MRGKVHAHGPGEPPGRSTSTQGRGSHDSSTERFTGGVDTFEGRHGRVVVGAMLNAETKQRLLDRLNEVHAWPSVYMFKLIFEPDAERLDKVLALFPPEAELLRKYSAGGKYLSITAREVMINAEEVVARYEVAAGIEGVIML